MIAAACDIDGAHVDQRSQAAGRNNLAALNDVVSQTRKLDKLCAAGMNAVSDIA